MDDGTEYNDQTFTGISNEDGAFTGTIFHGCTFYRCSFLRCRFVKCTFNDCTFTDCDLTTAAFRNSNLFGVRFQKSKAMGIDWTTLGGVRSRMPSVLSFEECVLDYSNFFGMTLHNTTMVRCIAREVRFAEADFTDSSFEGTDLRGSEFLQSVLTRADFRKALNYSIDPTANVVKGARFSLPEAVSLLRGFDIEVEWE